MLLFFVFSLCPLFFLVHLQEGVCVCVCERERESHAYTHTHTHTHTYVHAHTHTHSHTYTHTHFLFSGFYLRQVMQNVTLMALITWLHISLFFFLRYHYSRNFLSPFSLPSSHAYDVYIYWWNLYIWIWVYKVIHMIFICTDQTCICVCVCACICVFQCLCICIRICTYQIVCPDLWYEYILMIHIIYDIYITHVI